MNKRIRRVVRLVALAGVIVAGHAFLLAPAADAECLPCVYVRNDYPYAYAEVCPPLR